MLQKMSQPTLIIAILGSIKLILDNFGIHIPDATINAFANGIAALVTIVGIFIDHSKKPPATQDTPQQNIPKQA